MSKTKAQPVDAEQEDPGAGLRDKLGLKRFRDTMDDDAHSYLTRVLTATGGDRITAAAVAGLNRTHLQALIKRHNVDVKPNFKNRGRRRSKRENAANEAAETETESDVNW